MNDLNRVRDYLDRNFELQADIDASETINWNSGLGWEPIGDNTNKFTGSFNGNKNKITNLFINRETNYVGLFGSINGQVNNLKLIDLNINGNDNVGGLSGNFRGTETINIFVSGNLSGNNYVGGVFGSAEDNFVPTNIINSLVNNSDVNGNEFVGGIFGAIGFADANNLYNTGNVTGNRAVGGILGGNNMAHVKYSYNTGKIIAYSIDKTYWGGLPDEAYVGGIQGECLWVGCWFDNSFNTGQVISYGDLFGGLMGTGYTISNSYWDTILSGQEFCQNEIINGIESTCDDKYTENNLSYYYSKLNPPLDTWDFDTIWEEQTNNYPKLVWESQ